MIPLRADQIAPAINDVLRNFKRNRKFVLEKVAVMRTALQDTSIEARKLATQAYYDADRAQQSGDNEIPQALRKALTL